MGKKEKNKQFQGNGFSANSFSQDAEQSVIKHDMLKVVILNIVYLAGLLAVFYTNRNTHYLEKFFGKLFNF